MSQNALPQTELVHSVTSNANPLDQNGHAHTDALLGNMTTEAFAPASETIAHPTGAMAEALDIRDVIGDQASSGATGGTLNFSVNNDVVTLGIDIVDHGNNVSPSYFALANIQGVSGMSDSQILNALLANHEIKFD